MSAYDNFGDLPAEYVRMEDASIVFLPVPYDATSTWLKGADKGPNAIIEASAHMELYDIETNFEVYKKGIFTAPAIEAQIPELMVQQVYQTVNGLIDDSKFTVVVGGEHSVSIGSIQANAERYNGNISVLQLDAHSDLRDEYEGSKFNHACVMARAKELCPVVQVGIRSMDIEEISSADPDRMFLAEEIQFGFDWIEKIISLLTEKVYITIDLDVFDPSIMPSTGTPEPGGMDWYSVLNLLRAVAEAKDIVSFDVVELCPNGSNKAPDFLAAKLIYKLLSYKFGLKK